MTTNLKISGVQMDIHFNNKEKNIQNIIAHTKEEANQGTRLIVFPECSITGYCFASKEEAMEVAETIPGPSTEQLCQICNELNSYLICGLLEKEDDRIYNVSVLIGPNGIVGKYRKIHLPFLGVDRFTTPGDSFCVFEIEGVKVGMLICYDGTIPEASRVLALKGADIIILPTNWPKQSERVADHVVISRAIENRVYFLSVNRIGTENGFEFFGKSKFCAPDGSILDQANHDQFQIISAEIDVNMARNKKNIRIPGEYVLDNVNTRKPELYGDLVKKS